MWNAARLWMASASIFALVAVLLAASYPRATVSGAGFDARVFEMGFDTNDIVYDAVTQRVYASVPGAAGTVGNNVATIDPTVGAVDALTPIGEEPYKLALSGDGRYLYVALRGTASVRRLDMATQMADPPFALGSDPFFGPYYAEDMAVLSGNDDAIAISRMNPGYSPRHAGVAIYRGGVQLPNATPRHTGSNVIEAGATAARLYGYNNETTEFGFRRMDFDESGVSVLDVTTGLISGFGLDIVLDGGRVYASKGHVIDPEARTVVGTYPGIGFGSLVRPDWTVGRTFFLTNYGGSYAIQAFDQATFALVGSIDIPGVYGTPGSLIRWGQDGLAFRTEHQVFFIQSALVSGQPAPTPTSTAVPTETPVPLPTNTPTATPTSTPTSAPTSTPTSTPTATPPAGHVGDLDASGSSAKNAWRAGVTIEVHDQNHNPIAGAIVSGRWGDGYMGTGSCTTATTGRCSVTTPDVPKRNGAVTFTVNNLSRPSAAMLYVPADNHDPDGDSNGTWIVVNKP